MKGFILKLIQGMELELLLILKGSTCSSTGTWDSMKLFGYTATDELGNIIWILTAKLVITLF